MTNSIAQSDRIVYVKPQDPARVTTRWQWVKQYHAAYRQYSRETFATENEAMRAAIDIARCSGMKFIGTAVTA